MFYGKEFERTTHQTTMNIRVSHISLCTTAARARRIAGESYLACLTQPLNDAHSENAEDSGLGHRQFPTAQARANIRIRSCLVCCRLHSRKHLNSLNGQVHQHTLIPITLHALDHSQNYQSITMASEAEMAEIRFLEFPCAAAHSAAGLRAASISIA